MTALSSPASDLVLLGICGGAHGIRGEVRVRSFTAEPEEIGAYGPLRDANGRVFTVQSARQQKNVVVVRFREVADRNAAERLNGVELFVPREALPEEGEDEFYLSDLVGLVARLTTGEVSEAGVSITGGLSGTERVVLTAGAFLNPGQKVIPNLQKRN